MITASLPISVIDSDQIPSEVTRNSQFRTGSSTPDLVLLAQAGDDDAFSQLYALYTKRVFLICMRMVRNFSLAEDLTQETFLLVHRKISSFRGDSAFATWLHRLTVNTVLMHLRKRTLSLVSLDHLMADVPEERAGRSFGTRDLMQAGAIDRLVIGRAVSDLAPGYRSIFLLHDVEGFNHDEIAGMLKCTRGNTKSQLHKARRAMRGAIALQTGQAVERSAKVEKDLRSSPARASRSAKSTGSKGASAFQG